MRGESGICHRATSGALGCNVRYTAAVLLVLTAKGGPDVLWIILKVKHWTLSIKHNGR